MSRLPDRPDPHHHSPAQRPRQMLLAVRAPALGPRQIQPGRAGNRTRTAQYARLPRSDLSARTTQILGDPVVCRARSQVTSCDWGWSAEGAQVSAVISSCRSAYSSLAALAAVMVNLRLSAAGRADGGWRNTDAVEQHPDE